MEGGIHDLQDMCGFSVCLVFVCDSTHNQNLHLLIAGHDTKALMNNRGPRHKRSKLERQINRDVIWCVVALFLMCFMCSLGKCLPNCLPHCTAYSVPIPAANDLVFASYSCFFSRN